MFSHFDFSALDDPSFKEDAVREELLGPIIRRLGYSPTGLARVERSKTLAHPYVRIGTRKHPVSIVPDYTLLYDNKPILVLDAKRPSEKVTSPKNIEQAYSYAIHPEIRCRHFALCNGHELSVYDVDTVAPIAILNIRTADSIWSEFERLLSPRFLLEPALRNFDRDFGLIIARMGLPEGTEFTFPSCELQCVARVTDDIYTASAGLVWDEVNHLVSFDMGLEHLRLLSSCLPCEVRASLAGALSRAPFFASLDRILNVDIVARLGKPTQGQHDVFVPFDVVDVPNTKLAEPLPTIYATDLSDHDFRLRDALKRYRAGNG